MPIWLIYMLAFLITSQLQIYGSMHPLTNQRLSCDLTFLPHCGCDLTLDTPILHRDLVLTVDNDVFWENICLLEEWNEMKLRLKLSAKFQGGHPVLFRYAKEMPTSHWNSLQLLLKHHFHDRSQGGENISRVPVMEMR